MAQIYYNHDNSISLELENIDDVILLRNVLVASISRINDKKDYDSICEIAKELTEYIDTNKPTKRYHVYTDSESELREVDGWFDNIDHAHNFASSYVHQYDGKSFRVILHIDDDGECVDTVENIIKEED